MAISRFSDSTVKSGFLKYQNLLFNKVETGDTFTSMGAFPKNSVYAGSSGYYDGNIYYVGGETSDKVYKYNISSNSWTAPLSYTYNEYTWGTINHGGNDRIYSFNIGAGGANEARCNYYSITNNSVTSITSSPEAGRRGRGVVDSTATYGYLQTGYTSSQDDSFYRYNISSNNWSTMTSLPEQTYDFGIAYDSSEGMIYRAGGFGSNKFHQYNIANNTWTEKTNIGYTLGFGVGLEGKVWYLGTSGNKMSYYNSTTNTWTTRTATNTLAGSTVAHLINHIGTPDLYIVAPANSSTETVKYKTR